MNTRGVSEKFQEWQKRATHGARKVGTTTDQYVREKTWSTIALAAIVGCVLGYLLVGSREEEES